MDLEEDVAQLVEQLRVVAAVGRVGELVRLLDRVRDDRPLVLLAVPRALATQLARDVVELPEGRGDVLGRQPYSCGGCCGGACWAGGAP